MQSAIVVRPSSQSPDRPVGLSDVAMVFFRKKRLFAATFLGIMVAAVCVAFLMPREYESAVEILVQHRQADNALAPQGVVSYQGAPEPVSVADLDSEMQLMQTQDILHQVVIQTGLAGKNASPKLIDETVVRLRKYLKIAPIAKSNVIKVRYHSTNPKQTANVLNVLISLYLRKHLQILGSRKEYEFFNRQVQGYKARLDSLEQQLGSSAVVSPALERDQLVSKQSDLSASQAAVRAAIQGVQDRIASLLHLEKNTPQRILTEKSTSDNPQLLQEMKGTLLKLELQRDHLLSQYQPTYRPVIEIEQKIKSAKDAIAQQESQPLLKETTDQNSAYGWIATELAKSEAQLQSLRGEEQADSRLLEEGDGDLRDLNKQAIAQENLSRAAKAAESNYLFYLQKREQARVGEELGAQKLLNVVVVQHATVPTVPMHGRVKILALGFCGALILSLAVILVADLFDPRFRSVHELAATLEVPVLASIPYASGRMVANATVNAGMQNDGLHGVGSSS
jgi:uncharacterized protein involved in exopolysaccharide biosynthesis